MAKTPADPSKPKQTRKAAGPKAAYFILQVLDEHGQPMEFPKSRLKIVSVERSADKVLEVVESGSHPHAVYLRGMLPAGRGAA
jgi:hypothetical protein